MLTVQWTSRARTDVAEILDELTTRSPQAAERLSDALEERCDRLGRFPRMGRNREELHPGLRSIVVSTFLVFYRVKEDAVEILRVIHGARDIESIITDNGV